MISKSSRRQGTGYNTLTNDRCSCVDGVVGLCHLDFETHRYRRAIHTKNHLGSYLVDSADPIQHSFGSIDTSAPRSPFPGKPLLCSYPFLGALRGTNYTHSFPAMLILLDLIYLLRRSVHGRMFSWSLLALLDKAVCCNSRTGSNGREPTRPNCSLLPCRARSEASEEGQGAPDAGRLANKI